MSQVEVLVIPQSPDAVLDRIAKVDPHVNVIDARGWFDGELRATWPQWTVDRYLGDRPCPATTVEQRNQGLAAAEIILVGWPPVKNLRAPARRDYDGCIKRRPARAILSIPICGNRTSSSPLRAA